MQRKCEIICIEPAVVLVSSSCNLIKMKRKELVGYLAAKIDSIEKPHPVRVGIDGPDTAGKTTLAEELAREIEIKQQIEVIKRKVVRVALDGFHNPREIRYDLGMLSPEGYYNDSFNYSALKAVLLDSLGPRGSGHYIEKIFDCQNNMPEPSVFKKAEGDEVVLMDGIFLFRPELKDSWDFKIFLEIDRRTMLNRALQGKRGYLQDSRMVDEIFKKRNFPALEMYYREADPQGSADVVVDNNDPENPRILKGE